MTLGGSSDRSWRWFGEHDPYYGVLTDPKYHRANLAAETLSSFFASGEQHIEHVLSTMDQHFGAIPRRSCLDFGCGVGRLLVPLSKRFDHVVGVDISPAMLSEARKNCSTAELYESLDEIPGQFDFVHSHIVLQHIPVSRGMIIIAKLIGRVPPCGAAYLHVSIGRDSRFRALVNHVSQRFAPLYWATNLIRGRPVFEPFMQINRYPLNAIMMRICDAGIAHILLENENHHGHYKLGLMFRRNSVPEP